MKIRWVSNLERMVHVNNLFTVLIGKPNVKRSIGRPRRRWQENIKANLVKTV